jgi:MFS transporter, FSR family, fosmidomycin resistance protein
MRQRQKPAKMAGEGSFVAANAAGRRRLDAETVDRKTAGLLAGCHLVGDINQGAVGPLAALFVTDYKFSYASVGTLIFATTVISIIAQPILGHVADKGGSALFLPIGVLLASAGVALTGLTTRYWLIFVLLALSGLGVAAYHPVAARFINQVAPTRRGTTMSVFSVGGTLGLALGSLLLGVVVSGGGLQGTAWLLLPSGAMAVLLISQVRRLNTLDATAAKRRQTRRQVPRDSWGRFALLTMVIIGRSVAFYGLTVFVPLYWIVALHASRLAASAALAAVLLSGVAGSLTGGRIADANGPRGIILTGLGLLALCLVALALAPPGLIAALLLLPLGFGLYAPHSVMVAMGQEMLPNHVGVASGVALGLAVSTGGLAAPLLGHIGDLYGIRWVFGTLAATVLLAATLAATLPRLRLGETA